MATDTMGTSVVVTISGPPGQANFSPALLTIHIYDTVIFVNQSTTPYAVAADDTSFSSPAITHNQQWSTTFSILGAHSYHATSATSSNVTAIGEILVVADNVILLPTPQPQIEATAFAIIQAGKHPPDVIQLPTSATPTTAYHLHLQQNLQTRLLSFPVPVIAGSILAFVIFLVLLFIIRSRRKHRRTHDDEWTDDAFSDMYDTHAYQGSRLSTTAATLIAHEIQQAQVAKTIQAAQMPKRTWYIRLFQTIKTLHSKKVDEDDEENEDDEYEA